ncbi:MAG: GLUG motif-containing protein [Planctomycetota bacterium]|jgi:Tol biopolymer transport system component
MAAASNSRFLRVIPLLIAICFVSFPAQAKYSGGSGTAGHPYLIYTAEQMNAIGTNPDDFDKHFKLMADIDLSSYTGTDLNIIGDWDNAFTGVFDGNSHTISNFTYTSAGRDDVGLFACIGSFWDKGEIKNLGLINPNVDAGTGGSVSSLVGDLEDGTISNCYAEGGSVSGGDDVGGLVGKTWDGAIVNCYSTTRVSGTLGVGGLVGDNWSTITNCYAAGGVSGEWFVGGLVGSTFFDEATGSFWDVETSGQATSDGGTGKTRAQMQMASTFTDAGWDFVGETANGTEDVWKILEGRDYPRLWWEDREDRPGEEPNIPPDEEPNIPQLSDFLTGAGTEDDPYLIYTAEQMNLIALYEDDWDKHFRLMADIDLSGYTGTDFNIIGYWVGLDSSDNRPFTGVFDGNGHTISNFTYTSTGKDHIGLFGYIEDPDAEIKDVGLIDPNIDAGTEGWGVGSLTGYLREGTITRCYVEGGRISGNEDVGGLVGDNYEGSITNCCSNVSVSGNVDVGGLAGSGGTITNCYSTGDVSGNECVGGLAGSFPMMIMACYSTGHVDGAVDVGGLVGLGGGVIASFWDIETSGQLTSSDGTGRTTAQMQTASTFFVWNGCGNEGIWTIDEGNDYPRLWWENKPGKTLDTQQLSDFLTGAGTQDDPYLIYTAEQLNTIGLFPCDWDKHFKLMADIDLGAFTGTDFNVIGVGTDDAFGGVFDGNGKKISNFTYTSTKVVIVGLFPYVRGAGAEIKDLGLIDPNVGTGTVGWGWGVGPLVGWLEEGTITDCYVEGGIVSGDADVGGLVGSNQDSIADCYAIGIIWCNSGGGGLVGNNWGDTIITNCYSAGSVSGNECVGGLVGSNLGGDITTCYSASSVMGGGIVAGLVGSNEFGMITDCYASGDISGSELIGGLVGDNYSFFGLGTITNCYARGAVSGNELVGGLVGENTEIFDFELGPLPDFDWGTLSNSFWDIQTSGQATSDGGTGKTTAQMQMASTFTDAGWDFVDETANGTEDIWWILEGQDYPRLWWEGIAEIAFFSRAEEGHGIYVIKADGKGLRRIVNITGFFIGNISWSPDGRKIAFASEKEGPVDIYIVNADGSQQENLTNDEVFNVDPSFSPDGKKIVFCSIEDGNPEEIYIMNSDGSSMERLTDNLAHDYRPVFSPCGNKIAFLSTRNSDREVSQIYVMNTDGSEQTQLTAHPGGCGRPCYSPNGKKIAFYANERRLSDNARLCIMNADGSDQKILTEFMSHQIEPSFSPDGQEIAYAAWSGQGPFLMDYNVYVTSAEGTEIRQLTDAPFADVFPSWSPDGKKIAFVSRRDGNAEIYVMNPDGTEQRRLTKNRAWDGQPYWSPLPDADHKIMQEN